MGLIYEFALPVHVDSSENMLPVLPERVHNVSNFARLKDKLTSIQALIILPTGLIQEFILAVLVGSFVHMAPVLPDTVHICKWLCKVEA